MPNYRRWRQEGGCFFLTVVTYGRRPLFADSTARDLLGRVMKDVSASHPWKTEAVVLLPDHWHALWRLPEKDTDYTGRIARIKKAFTAEWLARGGGQRRVTPAQARSRRRGVWQPKFWEHTIRDARDFKLHLDYIHSNPVKHELAARAADWPWSSFHRWAELGEYDADWAGQAALPDAVEYFWHDA